MKYREPEMVIALFDREVETDAQMSRIHGTGNTATQSLEQSSNSSVGTDAQVFKFIWE